MKINSVYLKGQNEVSGYNNVQYLIIHHPEFNGSVQALNDVMRNMGFTMIGYNYYVRKDGSVWKGRPDNVTSGNCYNYNNKSLGICFEGNYDKDKTMPEAQFNSGVELIKELKAKYGVPMSKINGHKKFYDTDCPGRYFPLAKMLDKIGGSTSSNNGLVNQSGVCTVIVDSLNVREKPSSSSKSVATYSRGEKVKYDKYIDSEGYRWISWIGGSGLRRYMAVRVLSTNKKYGNCV